MSNPYDGQSTQQDVPGLAGEDTANGIDVMGAGRAWSRARGVGRLGRRRLRGGRCAGAPWRPRLKLTHSHNDIVDR